MVHPPDSIGVPNPADLLVGSIPARPKSPRGSVLGQAQYSAAVCPTTCWHHYSKGHMLVLIQSVLIF